MVFCFYPATIKEYIQQSKSVVEYSDVDFVYFPRDDPSEMRNLPSGKHTQSYSTSPFSLGKSTRNGHFSMANCLFPRGYRESECVHFFLGDPEANPRKTSVLCTLQPGIFSLWLSKAWWEG